MWYWLGSTKPAAAARRIKSKRSLKAATPPQRSKNPKEKKTRCFCDQTNSRAFRPSNGTAQLGYPTPAPRSCTVAGKRAKGVPMLFPNSIEEYNCLARTRDNQPEDQNQKRDRSNQLTGAKGIVEPVRERARSGRGRVPSTRRCCQS
jgi:hypothetical protein